MCRIHEKVYVQQDGLQRVFEETTLCHRGRERGKTCSDAKRRRTEYTDTTSSPAASSPHTPAYNTQPRRPSISSKASTKDGSITSLKPEIHIEIGSKKGKGKSYIPTVSITTGKSKRISAGSTSGSEYSNTVRTGYPEMSPPPLNAHHGGFRPQLGHQRNPSSDESFSSSSRVPSLYYDNDSPSVVTTTTGGSSGNHPIIHDSARHVPSPASTTRGQSGSPASPYRTTEFKPSSTYDETPARSERDRRRAPSYAPEILGHDEDRQRRRDQHKRRQEAMDSELAAAAMREENQKHVRFEADRAKLREEERAQTKFAMSERRRAEEREQLRQQKKDQEKLAAREAAAKEAAARRSKPSASHTKPRRGSVQMTAAQAAEQQHLVAAEAYQMQQERIKAEAIEREEQSLPQPALQHRQQPSLQERQQDPGYYDPRGERATPLNRRPSQSSQQRPDLGRRNSTRDPTGPPIRQDRRQPPVAFWSAMRPDQPPPRRPSSSHGANPFMQPAPTTDAWDYRNMSQALPGQALPSARGAQVGHNFPSPQKATQRLGRAMYGDVFGDSDEDEKYGRRK